MNLVNYPMSYNLGMTGEKLLQRGLLSETSFYYLTKLIFKELEMGFKVSATIWVCDKTWLGCNNLNGILTVNVFMLINKTRT
jgi:hypothetical protein